MDIIEIVKLILPIIAILISIAAVFVSHKNIKKQIRVSKLEEMLEILNMLRVYYRTAYLYSNDLRNNEKYLDGKLINSDWSIINNHIDEFLSNIKKETIESKTARLYVLANSYLPKNDLKLKVISINQLYSDLFYTLFYKRLSRLKDKYNGDFPKPDKIYNILNKIEKDIVKEMKVGFDTVTFKEYEDYFLKIFIKECNS
ncbi:hypothetical protein [Chryseobacterium sp. Leaf394]|uniref:hypothetical protein n=1 Tax=Chryseobacterium sp. Leaf394 TaxID=1736361 RepID=UPI0006F52E82|nr:hypothetical protein [Chryseobacterium sp. Leaf394]KQS93003.1 hypothetical protein ASG21_11380 [Chryseobacterium sp. Leaf394]